jgi:soluble lytic murein transglycosylase
MGCWYLSQLKQEFDSERAAVAAYNAGRGQVQSWLEDGVWDGHNLEKIPFAETRKYVKNVMTAQDAYKRLYKDVWQSK